MVYLRDFKLKWQLLMQNWRKKGTRAATYQPACDQLLDVHFLTLQVLTIGSTDLILILFRESPL